MRFTFLIRPSFFTVAETLLAIGCHQCVLFGNVFLRLCVLMTLRVVRGVTRRAPGPCFSVPSFNSFSVLPAIMHKLLYCVTVLLLRVGLIVFL